MTEERELDHFAQEDCPICRSVREKRAESSHFQAMANLTNDETRKIIEQINLLLDQALAEGMSEGQRAKLGIDWFLALKNLGIELKALQQTGTPVWYRLLDVLRRVCVETMGLKDLKPLEEYFDRK